jgi:hypothetical protein
VGNLVGVVCFQASVRQECNTIRPHTSLNERLLGTGGRLAVWPSTASGDTKHLGIGFNSNLKSGMSSGGKSGVADFQKAS